VCAGLSGRFQNPLPPPLFLSPPLNAANSPRCVEESRLIPLSLPSSGTPSSGPSRPATAGSRLGEDCVVSGWWRSETGSSFSRTCRTISASRRTSESMGAASSKSSAFMRPNCLDLGWWWWLECYHLHHLHHVLMWKHLNLQVDSPSL
jgi:hypothetical protein